MERGNDSFITTKSSFQERFPKRKKEFNENAKNTSGVSLAFDGYKSIEFLLAGRFQKGISNGLKIFIPYNS